MFAPAANEIEFGGRKYDLALRFKRTYKPYAVRLVKTEEHDWPGTNNPQYFSSDIQLVSDTLHENRQDHIWMNNPLRFGGETFYQSGYFQNPTTGEKFSTLSVVDNTGWMIPYIGCMIVATGLAWHFLATLLRFIRRQSAPAAASHAAGRQMTARPIVKGERLAQASSLTSDEQRSELEARNSGWLSTAASYFPWVVVAVCAAMALSRLIPPSSRPDAMNLYDFGKLPIINEGRTKPISTFADASLWAISDSKTFTDAAGEKHSAVQWLLDLIADPDAADQHQVIYISNPELLDSLGLIRTKSHYYSIAEIVKSITDREKAQGKTAPDDERGLPKSAILYKFLLQQLQQADEMDAQKRTPYQERLLDLGRRLTAYLELQRAFDPARFPGFDEQDIKQNPQAAYDQTLERVRLWDRPPKDEKIQEKPKPLLVPIGSLDEVWHSYPAAMALARVNSLTGLGSPDQATKSFEAMFAAYGKHNVGDFNAELAKYRTKLESAPPKLLDPATVNFEAFFNHFAPFESAWGIYLLALFLALVGVLLWAFNWGAPLQRAAFGLIILGLALHTFALIARIHISGRPPVTTLYSAAVFIGWGGVVLGVILELVFRVGLGNVIAAALGVAGLGVASLIFQYLDAGKDTIVVPE
ncbi:MAG TPA: cytochrome c biogenesis protein ResB, partial [Pirellulales bacterium]